MSTLKSIATACSRKVLDSELHEEPFKRIVVDNFMPQSVIIEAFNRFPLITSSIWEKTDDDVEKKYRSNFSSEFDFPVGSISMVRVLNSSIMLKAISEVFGIPKLIPDPYFTGGGLNMQTRGGMLDVHVDGNYHDATGLNRRINAIVFLNPGWQKSWGGEFGVYDNKGEKLVEAIEPLMNRLVIFDTDDKSFHGTPNPLNCPDDVTRKSLILYYYTKEPRKNIVFDKPHSALWKSRGVKDKNNNVKREYS